MLRIDDIVKYVMLSGSLPDSFVFYGKEDCNTGSKGLLP